MILPDGKTLTNPISYVVEPLFDCKKCKKAKKNVFSFFAIMIGAAGVGMITALIYAMIGFQLGFQEWQLLGLTKLVMMFGAVTYLWWVHFNFDKMFCECD